MRIKKFIDYIECRTVRPGFTVAVDELPDQRAAIVAITLNVATGWEYEGLTAALEAWFAWNPEANAEPAGYTRRIDAVSKKVMEQHG